MLTGLAPAATAPVRAVTIEGKSIEGDWSRVESAGGLVVIVSGERNVLPPSDLMLLRWAEPATSQPASVQPVMVYLSDGSRVPARITASTPTILSLETSAIQKLELPLSAVAAIRFSSAVSSPEAEEAFSKALSRRDAAQDVLVAMREGRVTPLRGVTESIGPDGGSFRWRDRSVPIRPESAYGVVFAAGVQRAAVPAALCHLRDGSVWAGTISGGDEAAIRLELTNGMPITIAVADLSEIRFQSGRITFLSDLEPSGYEFEPFTTTRWPYRRDRSVSNRPLRIGDQAFERGIGMHSQSKLSYELPDRFTHLAATIGIDQAARPRGNVVFLVIADGKEVFNSGPVTGDEAARPILVPLDGTRKLQLVVEFGDELDIGDQADWGNVRLIK